MKKDFFKKLEASRKTLVFRAEGRHTGHVLTVSPKNTKKSKKVFSELLGVLAAGLVGGGMVVFRSMGIFSGAQVLGITGAALAEDGKSIALVGLCLQAGKKTPKNNERFCPFPAYNFPQAQLEKFLGEADHRIKSIVDEFYFLEYFDKDKFRNDFLQAGAWSITDNIGLIYVRKIIFPNQFMLFSAGPLEILFHLRGALSKVVPDIRALRFDKELIEAFYENRALGLISDDIFHHWQDKFMFSIADPLKRS